MHLAHGWCLINIYRVMDEFKFVKTMGEMLCLIRQYQGLMERDQRLLYGPQCVAWSSHVGELFGNLSPSERCPS